MLAHSAREITPQAEEKIYWTMVLIGTIASGVAKSKPPLSGSVALPVATGVDHAQIRLIPKCWSIPSSNCLPPRLLVR